MTTVTEVGVPFSCWLLSVTVGEDLGWISITIKIKIAICHTVCMHACLLQRTT